MSSKDDIKREDDSDKDLWKSDKTFDDYLKKKKEELEKNCKEQYFKQREAFKEKQRQTCQESCSRSPERPITPLEYVDQPAQDQTMNDLSEEEPIMDVDNPFNLNKKDQEELEKIRFERGQWYSEDPKRKEFLKKRDQDFLRWKHDFPKSLPNPFVGPPSVQKEGQCPGRFPTPSKDKPPHWWVLA